MKPAVHTGIPDPLIIDKAQNESRIAFQGFRVSPFIIHFPAECLWRVFAHGEKGTILRQLLLVMESR